MRRVSVYNLGIVVDGCVKIPGFLHMAKLWQKLHVGKAGSLSINLPNQLTTFPLTKASLFKGLVGDLSTLSTPTSTKTTIYINNFRRAT